MIRILIWPWLLLILVLSFSMFPWWYYPQIVVLMIFAYFMDKKLKDKYTYHKPENQAPDDFDPIY